jgi:hypothetical protein
MRLCIEIDKVTIAKEETGMIFSFEVKKLFRRNGEKVLGWVIA